MEIASLCILAYKRPEWLNECLDSIIKTIDYPCEIIVNCDGGDRDCYNLSNQYLSQDKISKLIVSNGKNRGVGRSFLNCISLCEGNYIFKIDTDLIFKEGWLSKSVFILKNYPVGAVGLFDYKNYDPNDNRFIIEKMLTSTVGVVNDFVSSVYGFTRKSLNAYPYSGDDDGYHQTLKQHGDLVITVPDLVHNRGFGIGKSVYLSGTMDKPYKTPTYSSPLIFPKIA
jgi:cellulose synthase/poly-beta-1,6-N-acetylglucosamine synthase-like glycosyltransferase